MGDESGLSEGDNPTIGLILCTEKDEVVAKYSVLKDRKQIFASKYMLYLPTEEELQRELERERRLIEAHRDFPESEIQAAPDLPASGRKKSLKSQLEKGSSHGKA